MFLETKPHKFSLNLLVLKYFFLRNLYIVQSTVPQVVLNFWIPGLLMLTSLLDDERKLTLNMCSEVHCDYFSPELFRPCYCCPDVSRKEYCHLKLEDCRATCTTCKPKCSWKLHRYSVMEGWSSGCNIEHKLKHYHFLFLNFGIRRHTCCMRIMFYAYCVLFYVLMISLEIKTD